MVSAFASTTGIIGALIPLAVPFLLTDQVSAVGLIAALAISSSVVDCSPFSTNGALVVANTEPDLRDMVFRRLMQWGCRSSCSARSSRGPCSSCRPPDRSPAASGQAARRTRARCS